MGTLERIATMGGDSPADFIPHGRTDDETPTDIAKVSVAARSDALVVIA